MFERARLTLTAWYLVIIMTISLLFSFVIYSSITAEFGRFEKFQIKLQDDLTDDGVIAYPPRDHFFKVIGPDPEFIENAKRRVLFVLGIINMTILGVSGAAGYFLAGRTLRPIKKIVDEQKRFVTDASHELRTPLTSLRTEIEVGLRNKKLSLADAQKLLTSNLEEVVSLQTLSDNLLELAQNGRLINPKNMTDVSLTKIVQAAIKKVSPLAKKKEITIKSDNMSFKVKGIEDRLIEVCIILLENAIKYSSEKSTVWITAKQGKNVVSLAVTDEGDGIAKKDLSHIFDRFYRADISRSKTAGYGLGLSIAKKIMESHNGSIVAESKLHKGTIFKLVFRLFA